MNRFVFLVVLLLGALCAPLAQASTPADNATPATAASAASASSTAEPATPMQPLKPNGGDADSGMLVANLMTRYQYQAAPLDDAMSEKILAAYLESLDSQRMFFTGKDIDQFEKWKDSLDDAIWEGNLAAPYVMFNRYRAAMSERIAYARELLKKGFDFDKQESYQLDRSEAAWPADQAELDDLWRKRVKNDWLRLKLADKNDADIRELLDKRYAGYLKRVGQIESGDVFQMFMNAYVGSTDPHTSYLGPRAAENFDIAMKLSLEGIGAVLEMRGDYTQIRELVPGGPAAKSGAVHPGDRVVGVAQGAEGVMQDVIGWRLDDVVDKIRGKKGTTVRLQILPAESGLDALPENVELVREKVSIVEQAAKKSIIDVTEGDTTYKIGVIDLPSFYQDFAAHRHGDADFRSASRDVAKLIGELKDAKVDAIIMDLRNNGGGSLSEATRLTGLFIDTGPVVQVRDWRGRIESQDDDDPGMLWAGPLAVLVNRGSASASEIFTAAIQDYGRGIVVGSDTFGKGTVQNLVDLDNVARDDKVKHGELKMTIAQFFRVDGGSTQLRGVTPDISFPSGVDKDEFGESSYKNAMAWSSITPANFEPVADVRMLIPRLRTEHEARTAKDPEWQLRNAQFALAEKMRQRTEVSLNLEQRRSERKQYEADRDALTAKYRGEEKPAAAASTASAASAEVAPAASGPLRLDDGLQANERSLTVELAREEAAEDREDVQLNEVANILVDEVSAIQAKPALAATVLPKTAKTADNTP